MSGRLRFGLNCSDRGHSHGLLQRSGTVTFARKLGKE
jgi:hypothetical protein